MMIYKADSIRIASYQARQAGDIGRFRPRVLEHELQTHEVDAPDGNRWTCALPFGSSIGSEDSADEAIQMGLRWAHHQGWVTDRATAENQSIEHARSRKNSHPNR